MNDQDRRGSKLRWFAFALSICVLIIAQLDDRFRPLLGHAVASPISAITALDDLLPRHPDVTAAVPVSEPMDPDRNSSLSTEGHITLIAGSESGNDADLVVAGGELPAIELVGTLLSSRADIALVIDGSSHPRRLRVGDTVSDWKVVHIRRDNLLLRQDDDFQPIRMR